MHPLDRRVVMTVQGLPLLPSRQANILSNAMDHAIESEG
jgi:hypothetical protein